MRINRVISAFLTIAMFMSCICVTAFAESGIEVLASENFDSFDSASYSDFAVSYNSYAQQGKPFAYKYGDPTYGNTFAFAQAASGAKANTSVITFGLNEPISLSSAQEGEYLELSYDVKCGITSSSFMCAVNGTDGKMFTIWLYAQSDSYNIYVGNSLTQFCYTYSDNENIENSWPKNVRVQYDLYNKKISGVYLDGIYVEGNSGNGLDTITVSNSSSAEISSLAFNWGNGNSTVGSDGYSYLIDNLSIVSYTSETGASPLADKKTLRELIGKMYNIQGLDSVTQSKVDEAVKIATEVYMDADASQSEVDEAYAVLEKSAEPPPNEEFMIYETFEGDLTESEFFVTYGEGITTSEIYDDTVYGNGTLKLKTDGSKKNVSQYVDFGFGNNAIKCSDEDPNCYVEFGIDFSSYNMSLYAKNIFIYFMDSSSNANLACLYITGGNKILLSGTPSGDITFGSIEDPSKMKNVRVVMQITDDNGKSSQKITAIYADDVLLEGSYPIEMQQAPRFDKVRVMISNIKDSDFEQNREWGTNIDNLTVTKFYAADGKSSLHTAGELVSLMRSYDAEASANYQNGSYTAEQLNRAREAINSAALVYLNTESTAEQIDSAYKELYSTKKRLTLREDKTFDIADISTSAGRIPGNDEISMDISIVTAQSIAQAISPTVVGVLLKNNKNSDELLDTELKTVTINPDSNGEVNLSFDVLGYTDDEKDDMYIKLFVFENISEMKLADVEMPVLFGEEGNVQNEDYRYLSRATAYQLVEDEVISVFSVTGKPEEENVLCVFKSDFDFKDFSDEELLKSLVYVDAGVCDENGKCAFALSGIPSGEYVYSMNGSRGKLVSSDNLTIENALNEVCENPDKLEENIYILGIDEELYQSAKANGINPTAILEDILKENSYSISDILKFGDDLSQSIEMLNELKSAKTIGYVAEALEKYSGKISNISAYTSLTGKKKSIAEEYILNNNDDIVSLRTLEDIIEDAAAYAKKQSNTSGSAVSGGGGGSGGGGSYPAASNSIVETEKTEKEYGVITDVHTSEFTDLDSYDWARPAIAFLVKKGSVNGKANGIFAPGDKVTREEFVKMLLLTFDYDIKAADSIFSDVDNSSWYAPYVMSAVNAGIVKGVSETIFGTGALITREDASVLIARVLEGLNVAYTEDGQYIAFVDDEYISDYAFESVKALAKSGIINGMSDNRFAPAENASRAEAAKLIYEAYMFMVSKGV